MSRAARHRLLPSALAVAALLAGTAPATAQRRDAILATGSSTVAPFTNAVADTLAQAGARRATVRSTGTVHGFNEFCRGPGLQHPDVQNASRRINATEFALCARNGVREIMEIAIGHDGIVIAHRTGLPAADFSLAQLWLGIAREVPRDGRLVPNPYTSWRQIGPALPAWPIRLIGPPPTSGTRDIFIDLVLLAGCQAIPEVRAIADTAQRRRVCVAIREDGGWIDGGEDDEVIVRRVVEGEPGTLGVFGFSFLEAHRDRIAAAAIAGVPATREAIGSGAYPVARPLFIYVKQANLRTLAGLPEFIAEYVSDRAMGPEGYLIRRGLVPLDPVRLRRVQEAVRDQAVMLRQPDD
jgi:phosphate transport system substrate-binding protein